MTTSSPGNSLVGRWLWPWRLHPKTPEAPEALDAINVEASDQMATHWIRKS